MLHKTKGIVLNTIKYGETSIVTNIYTELFGIQAYMIKGVRQSSKKGTGKANMFQSGAILDMIVYHNELKNLQIIKEFKWSFLYQNIYKDIVRNSVALFMVELIIKSIKQPEANAELFYFIEECLILLDEGNSTVAANLPLYFALHFAKQMGFGIKENADDHKQVLDIKEGLFTEKIPAHGLYIDDKLSEATMQLLRISIPLELDKIHLNQNIRRQLLLAYEQFYIYHINLFKELKTPSILAGLLE